MTAYRKCEECGEFVDEHEMDIIRGLNCWNDKRVCKACSRILRAREEKPSVRDSFPQSAE